MAHGMTRREFAGVGGAGLFALASGRAALGAESKTLRFIVRTDLRVLDPIWTTAYVSSGGRQQRSGRGADSRHQ